VQQDNQSITIKETQLDLHKSHAVLTSLREPQLIMQEEFLLPLTTTFW